MKASDINERLYDEPFKPFRIKTTLSNVYEIKERWMILLSESSAVIALEPRIDEGHPVATKFRTVALSHMVEIEDISPAKNKGRKSA